MKKEETKFRAKIRPFLENINDSFWESIQQRTILGTPDILGCIAGVFIALELKVDDGKLSALQEYKLSEIRRAGGLAYVVTPKTWPRVYEELVSLSNGEEE